MPRPISRRDDSEPPRSVLIGNMANDVNEIQGTLDAPGAGLPAVQATCLRYLAFPAYCLVHSWDKALVRFNVEGQRMTQLANTLSKDELGQRVLIKAPVGIEDSSRFWSAAMVFEHLIEVGSRVAVGIVELTHGTTVTVKADIADVKPTGQRCNGILSDYSQFLDDFSRILTEDVGDRRSEARHPHPWFGELNAHQWICLAAIHQTIHRKQLERILVGLRK